jgi:hypothetical protein
MMQTVLVMVLFAYRDHLPRAARLACEGWRPKEEYRRLRP